MVFTSTSRKPRLVRRRSRRGEEDYNDSPDLQLHFRAATVGFKTRQQLDTLLLRSNLPAKAQCLHKTTSMVDVVPVATTKNTSALRPCNLCSPPHKAHYPYHITDGMQPNGRGRLGGNGDEKAAANHLC